LRRRDDLARFARVEGLPCDVDGPVFAEPWQAQAFALTVQLSEAGCFTWQEWAADLGAVIREATAPEHRDDGSRYYDCWVFALERLCVSKGLTNPQALSERRTAWAEAYCRTPHGRPVELSGA
jgi:nitrile hydratase accessory protein